MRPIDADRLTESVHAYGIRGAGWSDSERESDVCSMIDNEPTLDLMPVVHARWIIKPHFPDGNPMLGGKMVCSNCGEMAPLDYDGKTRYKSAFCKGCGARMDANPPAISAEALRDAAELLGGEPDGAIVCGMVDEQVEIPTDWEKKFNAERQRAGREFSKRKREEEREQNR